MLDVSCIMQQFGLVVVDWSHRVRAMTFFCFLTQFGHTNVLLHRGIRCAQNIGRDRF